MDREAADLALIVGRLAATYLRPSTGTIAWKGTRYEPEFDPPLSTEEQATLERLFAVARAQQAMTPDAYDAVRAQMQGLRDLRQMGRNAFMALSATERDRLIYDRLTDLTIVLLAILRD